MPPLDPIQPPQLPPTGPQGTEGLRNDSQGGGGQGGRRRPTPAPGPVKEEDAEPDAHLDADSFAGRKRRGNLDALFSEKLPWEVDEDDKLRKLEDLHQKRLQPPQAGRGLPTAPKPPLRPPSVSKGRQVDGTFDPTTAVNSTLTAWQSMRERQAPPVESSEPPQRQGGNPLLQPLMNRPPVSPTGALPPRQPPAPPLQPRPPVGLEARGPIEQAPEFPKRPVQPPPRVRAPEPDPALTELPKPPGTARLQPPPPRLPVQPAAQTPPAPPLQGPPPAAQQAARAVPPRAAELPPARGPRPEPEERRPAQPLPPKPAAPLGKPAPPPAPLMPAPSWAVQSDTGPLPAQAELSLKVGAAPPAFDRTGMPAVRVSSTRGAFAIRVIDGVSGLPMAGARLEFEPTEDDMLPVLNGVSDGLGWWGESSVPPGKYQLSVRSPGYVPSFHPRVVVADQIDELAVVLTKP